DREHPGVHVRDARAVPHHGMGANLADHATGLRRRVERVREGTGRMKRLIIVAATLLAAACQPMPADGGRADFAEIPAAAQTSTDEAADCAARGGKMLPQGRMQSLRCVVSYSDAYQRCTDGDDCQGDCRVEE